MANTFYPGKFGRGISISASTTSATSSLNSDAAHHKTAYIYNSGPDMAFIRWGKGTQTALTTDLPLPAGSLQTFHTGGVDGFGAITAAGTATIYIYPGEGE